MLNSVFSPSTQCQQYVAAGTWEVTRAKEQLGGSSHSVNISILPSPSSWLPNAILSEYYFTNNIAVTEMLKKNDESLRRQIRGRVGIEE